jgi:hypothetical protein
LITRGLLSNKIWTPLIGVFGALKIIKKWDKIKKIIALKVKSVKNSKIQTIEHYKGRFPNIVC